MEEGGPLATQYHWLLTASKQTYIASARAVQSNKLGTAKGLSWTREDAGCLPQSISCDDKAIYLCWVFLMDRVYCTNLNLLASTFTINSTEKPPLGWQKEQSIGVLHHDHMTFPEQEDPWLYCCKWLPPFHSIAVTFNVFPIESL